MEDSAPDNKPGERGSKRSKPRSRPVPGRRFRVVRIILAVLVTLLFLAVLSIGWLFRLDWHQCLARRDPALIRPRTELYAQLAPAATEFAHAVCQGDYASAQLMTIPRYRSLFTRKFFDHFRARYTQLSEKELRGDGDPGRFIPFCEFLDEAEIHSMQRLNDRLAAVNFHGLERSAGIPVFQVLFERCGDHWLPAYSRVEAALVNLNLVFILPR